MCYKRKECTTIVRRRNKRSHWRTIRHMLISHVGTSIKSRITGFRCACSIYTRVHFLPWERFYYPQLTHVDIYKPSFHMSTFVSSGVLRKILGCDPPWPLGGGDIPPATPSVQQVISHIPTTGISGAAASASNLHEIENKVPTRRCVCAFHLECEEWAMNKVAKS